MAVDISTAMWFSAILNYYFPHVNTLTIAIANTMQLISMAPCTSGLCKYMLSFFIRKFLG